MNQFKFKIIGTLSALILFIVATLAALNYFAFNKESVHLHKSLLKEQNATINARLTEQFTGFRRILSSIEVEASDVRDGRLSPQLTTQLMALHRGMASTGPPPHETQHFTL